MFKLILSRPTVAVKLIIWVFKYDWFALDVLPLSTVTSRIDVWPVNADPLSRKAGMLNVNVMGTAFAVPAMPIMASPTHAPISFLNIAASP